MPFYEVDCSANLKVLFLDHPRKHIRDTAKYKPFQQRMRVSNICNSCIVYKTCFIRYPKHEEFGGREDS